MLILQYMDHETLSEFVPTKMEKIVKRQIKLELFKGGRKSAKHYLTGMLRDYCAKRGGTIESYDAQFYVRGGIVYLTARLM